jgi:hypothetical protein
VHLDLVGPLGRLARVPTLADESLGTKEPEIERRRLDRSRVWTLEADRERAYRERLAADRPEPGRLRREFRAT